MKAVRAMGVAVLAAGVSLAACASPSSSASHGNLNGFLEFVGGPLVVVHGKPVASRGGWAGRIFLASTDGRLVKVGVPKSGRFIVHMPPGNYAIWGGPRWAHYRGCWPTTGRVESARSGTSRINKGSVSVTANKTSHVTLMCPGLYPA